MAEATGLHREVRAVPLLGAWVAFFQSSVGAKMIMALTGLGLWVFIVGHLAGNFEPVTDERCQRADVPISV